MQNQKTSLPQADKLLAGQEVNLVASSYRVPAPAASTGPTDSGGGGATILHGGGFTN